MPIGILSMLAVVSLAQDTSSADSAASGSVANALAALKDWRFVLGPGFVCGIGNGILFGWLMYRSGLVPRRMTHLGLSGGPMICISGFAVMFRAGEPGGIFQSLATLPEFLWEFSVGIYFIVQGVQARTDPLRDTHPGDARTAGNAGDRHSLSLDQGRGCRCRRPRSQNASA